MKKTTRLLLAVLLVAVLCLSLTACKTHEHTYGDWTLTTAPTLTTEGTATHTCTDCNEIESVTVPALTDTSVWTATPNPAPTHTTAGKTDYTSIYGKVTVDVDALGDAHVFDQKNTDAKYLKSEATCTSAAVYYYSCVCGEKGTETFTHGEPLAHSYAFSNWATQPTLTEGGVANMECSVCHGTTTANVAALSDSTVWSIFTDKHVDSTCSAAGKDVYANATYGEVEVALATTAHTWTFASWKTEPTLTEDGVANLKCANCTATDTATVANLSDSSVWAHTHTDATFTKAAKDVYTATLYGEEVEITIDGATKQAPYLGKKYVGMRGTFSSSYTSDNMSISIDANATAKDTLIHKDGDSYGSIMGSYVYSNGKITFSILDDSGKLAITFSWTETDEEYGMDTEDKSEVHWGYVSADGNYIVINSENGLDKPFGTYYLLYNADALDSYATSGVLAGSSAVVNSLTVGGVEHIVYLEKTSVSFDVAINGEDGTAITVSQIAAQSKFTVVTANGTIGFAKSGSSFVKTDGLEGTYTCTDGTTAAIDGLGNVIVTTSDGSLNGTYTLNSDGTIDVMVTLADDSKMYLLVTLGEGNTFTYTKPMAEVTFVTNGGTLEDVTDNKTSLNIKVANTLPVPAYGEAFNFEGWYYDEACTTAVGETITLADTNAITLYAKVSKKAVVKFVDLIGEDQTYYLAVGDAFLANAPAYTNDTTKDGKLFRGWYVMVDGEQVAIDGELKVAEVDGGKTIEIHAKWADVVTLTKVFGNGQDDEVLSVAQGDEVELDGVNTLYKNGQLLVGWYDNAELSGDAITSLTVSGNTSVYAKWQAADPYVIDNEVSGARNWTYDETTDTWTSNNKGSGSTSAIFILTVLEDARVTFLYGASSEGGTWDYLYIVKIVNGVETQIYTDGGHEGEKETAVVFQSASVELKAGESLKFVYVKDSTTNGGLDIAQIKNLLVIGASHKHTYNKQVVADQYLATEATCQAAATYYYSCICGEHGEKTFSHGDKAAHHYVDGVCTWCKKAQPTFTLTAITNNGENKTISVKDGEAVDLVALAGTKSGYNFEGWYLDRDYTQAFDGVIDENVTIYAKWSPAASLAGSTYTGRYYNEANDWSEDGSKTPNTTIDITFTDSTTGILHDGGSAYYFNFTYVVSGNDITFTIGKNIDGDSHIGQTFFGVISGDTITLKKGTYSNPNVYKFYENHTVTKTSGGSSGSAHIHVYNQKTISADLLAVAAEDCQHHPAYYYSCTCGEHGSETFEDETSVGPHHYEGGVCKDCGAEEPTEKVEVTIDLADGSEATTKQIVKGSTLTLETPTRSGYKFLGWYIGEDPFVSGETTISTDVTITAKWQKLHEMTGEYLYGANLDPSESGIVKETDTLSGSSYKFTVDENGSVTGWKAGTIADLDSIAGTFYLNVSGSKYYGGFNAEAKVMFIEYNSNKTTAYHDIGFAAGAFGEAIPTATYNNAWDKGITKFVRITYSDESVKYIFIKDRVVYSVDAASIDAKDSSGKVVDFEKIYSDATTVNFTAKNNGGVVTEFKFAKVNDNFVPLDGLQGTYTGTETLTLDGHGGFTVGELSGTYTVAAESAGYTLLAKTSNATYKITLSGTTYTMEAYNVVASFDFGTLAELAGSFDEQIIPYDISTKLNDAPTIEGYKFRGWYENADFSGSANTTVTLTENKTYYAKYDAIVTITFDYSGYEYEEGATTKVVNSLAIGDTLGNTIPNISSDVRHEGKVFVGWFTKNGEEWGEQAASSTTIAAAVTYYAKWTDVHVMYGTYHGVEIYGASTTAIGGTNNGGYDRTYRVDILGVMSGEDSGTITDYNAETGYFMVGSRFGWYDAVNGILVYSDSASSSSLTADFHIAIKGATKVVSSTKGCWWNKGYTKLVTLTITKDKTYDVNVLVMNNKLYYNVTWTSTAGTFTDKDAYNATNLTILNANGEEIAKFEQVGNTGLQLNDGKSGTYSGEYGDVVVNGFGVVTIGEASASYTLDGNQITFIINNAMRTIALENGTYTKVLDGYEGEYTLPDGSKITLDGFGGAGDGKTYIVEKKTVTIFTDGVGTKYTADFATKELSIPTVSFAGKTYRKDNFSYIKFDDTDEISGTFYFEDDTDKSYVKFKNATFENNELTLTISSGDKNFTKGGKVVFTYDNGNLVLKSKAGIETDYCQVGNIFKLS